MWIVMFALVGVVLWVALRQPGNSAVASSALLALRESDALAASAWRKLEAMVDATVDPPLTCSRLLKMRKSELPRELAEHWQYIDDLAERSNRRAEHYESLAHKPAPPLASREVAETIMARIRKRAARLPAPAEDRAARAFPDAAPKPVQLATASTESVIEAVTRARDLVASRGTGRDAMTAKEVFALRDEASGLTKEALEYMALHAAVVGGLSSETAVETLREKRAYFTGLRDAGDPDVRRLIEPTLQLLEFFIPIVEAARTKA